MTSDPDTPFRAQMIAALSRALIERGNVPALISVGPTAGEVANAARQLLRYRAEATVFLSGSPPASLVELTRRNGQTLILINRAETEVDSVRCDDRGGARQAFEALRATGAARFAVVNMADPSPSLLAREQAFAAFAAARGSRWRSSAPATPTTRAGRRPRAGCWRAGRPPDAVFCVNDLMAFGALDHLRGAGLSVPDDVSVIGFDDVPMAGWASYAPHHPATGPCAHRQRGRRHPRPPRRRARPAADVGLLPGRACRPGTVEGRPPAAAGVTGGLTRRAKVER